MAQDERLLGVRRYIKNLVESAAIGDLAGHTDLREQIRGDVRSFRNKPWSARIGKFIVCAAVPAEIAGLLCNSHLIGVSVAALGTACEWLANIGSKRKGKHWLSMSRFPHYLKRGF